jgi:drug/metabolite transporter (DMT)-like permease
MTSSVLALCAATSWSLSHVFVRLGSRSVAPLAGVVLSLASSSFVLVIALAIRGDVDPNLLAVGLFALAGMTGPGLGRILSITAISRIGATRASPVKSAAQPVIAVVLGVVVLAETVELTRLTGIALTLTGVVLVVVSGQRAQASTFGSPRQGGAMSTRAPALRNLSVLLWPIGAGTAYALTDLTRKNAMQVLDDAFLGGAIGVLVALTIWGTVLVTRGGAPSLWRDLRSQNSIWFLVSGTASGAAQVFVLSALRDGDLSLVAPILAVQPILIAIFARVFINRLERVGIAVAGAALLATAGTALISL